MEKEILILRLIRNAIKAQKYLRKIQHPLKMLNKNHVIMQQRENLWKIQIQLEPLFQAWININHRKGILHRIFDTMRIQKVLIKIQKEF